MTQRRNVSSESEFEAAVGYSRAVRTGPFVAVAGTTAAGDDRRRPGTRSVAPHRGRAHRGRRGAVRRGADADVRHRHHPAGTRSAPCTPRCSATSALSRPWSRCPRSSPRSCWSRSRSTPMSDSTPSPTQRREPPVGVRQVGRDARHSRRRAVVRTDAGTRIDSGSRRHTGLPAHRARPARSESSAAAPGRCGRHTAGWRADGPAQGSKGGRSRRRRVTRGGARRRPGALATRPSCTDGRVLEGVIIRQPAVPATSARRETRHTRKRPGNKAGTENV